MPINHGSTPIRKDGLLPLRPLLERGEIKFDALPEAYEWRAKVNPEYPLFTFHDGAALHSINYAEAIVAIRRAARYVLADIPASARATRAVIGILAVSDTITFFTTVVGVLRAGHTPFLVSPRNGAAAVADMMQRVGCAHLLVSDDPSMKALAAAAVEQLAHAAPGTAPVVLRQMPKFEDLYLPDVPQGADDCADLPKSYDPEAISVILHSSGSTAHPKPIKWRQDRIIKFGQWPWTGEEKFDCETVSIHGMAMFHGFGAFFYMSAPQTGMVVATFKPKHPPIVATPDLLYEGMVATNCEWAAAVPAFIEAWATNPEQVAYLKTLRGVIFGGAPIKKAIGDSLVSQGVVLLSVYGATEVGSLNVFPAKNPGMDWQYMKFTGWNKILAIPTEDPGLFETYALSEPHFPLPVINTKIDGVDAYATNDLVEEHPTKKGYYRIYGRADDQLIMSNGEKTNPLPLEQMITEDSHVRACVMFGHGRLQTGVIVLPRDDLVFDPKDVARLEEFRNAIWPTIERVNEYAPQHSRIFKEMILPASPSKPFSYNMKGLPKRRAIIPAYKTEIDAVYADVEESAQSEIPSPDAWDVQSITAFLQKVVDNILRKPVAADADLFVNGCDSLQATWIRNTILRALRDTSAAAAKRLPMNVVFQAPSISALAEAVARTLRNDGAAAALTGKDLVALAEKYSADFPARPAALVARPSGKDVVMLTGTTGGFGCDILEHLLSSSEVERVYAFNRKGTKALERQRARFAERGLDVALLDREKFRMVEAELHVPGFGLEAGLLEEIRTSVTHILHNAWRVDFNMSLATFENDIKGVRNFVDLALSSPFAEPPKIQFVSSVGVLLLYTGPAPIPEMAVDPSSALASGYSQAKWISERILTNARERAGLNTTVVRLGQVAGDKTGHWNESEWFPAIVKSAQFQRSLPDMEGTVSFFPSYETARAFAEMRHGAAPFMHIVHPRPVAWTTLVGAIAAALGVPLVSYDAWLAALEGSVKRGGAEEVALMRENPALRLLDFFRAQKAAPNKEPMGIAHLDSSRAQEASETLRDLKPMDGETARRWVEAWRKTGFLKA